MNCFNFFSIFFFINSYTCNIINCKTINENQIENWQIEKISEKSIFFKNGRILKTNLYDLSYIGQLQTSRKDPYMILAGKSCNECDDNTYIYIHSPSDGEFNAHNNKYKYNYPGKLLNFETGKPIFESHMFYGKCFVKNKKNDAVVWKQSKLNRQGKWTNSTYVIEIENDAIKQYHLKSSIYLSHKNVTNCQEVNGITQTSEP